MKKTFGQVAAELMLMYQFDPIIKQRVDNSIEPVRELVDIGREHNIHFLDDDGDKFRLDKVVQTLFDANEVCEGE